MARAGAMFLCLLALSGAALAQSAADSAAAYDGGSGGVPDDKVPVMTVTFNGFDFNGRVSGQLLIKSRFFHTYTALATTVSLNNGIPQPIDCIAPTSDDDPVKCAFALPPFPAPAPGVTYTVAGTSQGIVAKRTGKVLGQVTIMGNGVFTVPAVPQGGMGRKMLQAAAADPVLTVDLQKPFNGMVQGTLTISNNNADGSAFIPLAGFTKVVVANSGVLPTPIACGDSAQKVELGRPMVCTFSLPVQKRDDIIVGASSTGYFINAQGAAAQKTIIGSAAVEKH